MDGAVTTDVRGQVRVVEGQERYAVWATPDSHKPAQPRLPGRLRTEYNYYLR